MISHSGSASRKETIDKSSYCNSITWYEVWPRFAFDLDALSVQYKILLLWIQVKGHILGLEIRLLWTILNSWGSELKQGWFDTIHSFSMFHHFSLFCIPVFPSPDSTACVPLQFNPNNSAYWTVQYYCVIKHHKRSMSLKYPLKYFCWPLTSIQACTFYYILVYTYMYVFARFISSPNINEQALF